MQGPSFFVPRNVEQAQEIQQATQAGSEGILILQDIFGKTLTKLQKL